MDLEAVIYGKCESSEAHTCPLPPRVRLAQSCPGRRQNASPRSSWAQCAHTCFVLFDSGRGANTQWLKGQNRGCAMGRIPMPTLPTLQGHSRIEELVGEPGLVNSDAFRTVSKGLWLCRDIGAESQSRFDN